MSKKKEAVATEKNAELVILAPEKQTQLSVDARVKNEIVKFTVPKVEIQKLKKKNAALKIDGFNDKKGYEAMKKAKLGMGKVRNAIEDKRKELKADYLKTGQGIDSFAEDLKKEVATGVGSETWCAEQLKMVDDELERLATEERERVAQQLQDRVTALEKAGMSWNGSYYAIGQTISVGVDTVRDLSEEGMEVLIKNVSNEKARLDEEQRVADELEAQRLAQIETDRLENERLANELSERERILNEREEKAQAVRTTQRKTFMHGIGLSFDTIKNQFQLLTPSGNVEVSMDVLNTEDDEEWDHRTQHLQGAILDIQREEQERLAEEKRKDEEELRINNRNTVRFVKVESLGFTYISGSDVFQYRDIATRETLDFSAKTVREIDETLFSAHLNEMATSLKDFKDAKQAAADLKAKEDEELRKSSLGDLGVFNEVMTKASAFINELDHYSDLFKTDHFRELYNEFSTTIRHSIDNIIDKSNQN